MTCESLFEYHSCGLNRDTAYLALYGGTGVVLNYERKHH